MKREELKRLIKPIVKECITESLIEEGILSSVVSEVMKGMAPTLVESAAVSVPAPVRERPRALREAQEARSRQAKESRKKLLDAIGKDAYNGIDLFEGTTPAPAQRSPERQASSPLGDTPPGDPGVDISSIVNLGGKNWKALLG
tara:strand:- start:124 stop:555 length:432 start_codon:yes stop_codon:yes gene_type:complete